MHHVTLPTGGPAWLITGYGEVRAVLHDPRLVKNASAQRFLVGDQLSPELFAAINHHMLNRDPPDHTRLRRLVTAAVTRRRIDELAPRIQQITDELLGAPAGAAQTDLIASFAHPLPITVSCELLGVPSESRTEFRAWSATLVTGTMADQGEFSTAATNGELPAGADRHQPHRLPAAVEELLRFDGQGRWRRSARPASRWRSAESPSQPARS